MTPEMQNIAAILRAGAASAMTIEEIIHQEISDWQKDPLRKLMLIGQQYYGLDNDVLKYKRMTIGEGGALIEAVNLANNKLPHGFVRKLVDQKVGYLLSKPLSIQTENTAYEDLLKEFFNKSFCAYYNLLAEKQLIRGKLGFTFITVLQACYHLRESPLRSVFLYGGMLPTPSWMHLFEFMRLRCMRVKRRK